MKKFISSALAIVMLLTMMTSGMVFASNEASNTNWADMSKHQIEKSITIKYPNYTNIDDYPNVSFYTNATSNISSNDAGAFLLDKDAKGKFNKDAKHTFVGFNGSNLERDIEGCDYFVVDLGEEQVFNKINIYENEYKRIKNMDVYVLNDIEYNQILSDKPKHIITGKGTVKNKIIADKEPLGSYTKTIDNAKNGDPSENWRNTPNDDDEDYNSKINNSEETYKEKYPEECTLVDPSSFEFDTPQKARYLLVNFRVQATFNKIFMSYFEVLLEVEEDTDGNMVYPAGGNFFIDSTLTNEGEEAKNMVVIVAQYSNGGTYLESADIVYNREIPVNNYDTFSKKVKINNNADEIKIFTWDLKGVSPELDVKIIKVSK